MSPLGAWSLNSNVRMSSVCSGGSDVNCGCMPLGGAGHAHRHAIGLAGHAHARLGLDVEERLDAVGIRKIQAAARDQVAAALELDFATLDLGAAEQQRTIERAAHGQIGARDDARLVVVDAQGAPAPVKRTSNRNVGGGARPALRSPECAASPPVRPLKRPPDAPKPRVQVALLTVTVPVTIGAVAGPCSARRRIDDRAHAFGIAQASCPRRWR